MHNKPQPLITVVHRDGRKKQIKQMHLAAHERLGYKLATAAKSGKEGK